MDPHQALESLLLSLFSAEELRQFLRYLPEGRILDATLPGATASAVMVAHESVRALAHHNLLTDPEFWRRIVDERPRRADEVEKVHALFTAARAPMTTIAPASTAARISPVAPSVLTILLASASPSEAVRLRVDREFRQVIEKLRGSRHRDRLRVVQLSAVRFEDLRTALMEHEPHVLHLSCHGEPDGSLRFEPSADSATQIVPKKNLLKLLRALRGNLRLAVFNACHSAAVARDVPPTIDMSIGMTNEILDAESIEFTVAFYEALAFGKSVQTAFDTALAGLNEDDEIPRLYPAAEQDPENRRQQPLIGGAGP